MHTHTAVHTHTHTVNTHPEQWAANAAAPGEKLGVRSRVSPQSWYWRWREHLLFTPPHRQFLPARDSNPQPRVTSPMLHPFGHDCLYDVLTQISNDFQRSLYRVQCRQTSGVDTVLLTYREEPKQPRCTIAGLLLLESSPALGSWSNIYTGPTSWYSPRLFVKLHTLPFNWSKVTVKTFITFQNIIFQVNAVLLKILFIKESW